jgi:hypothetical protein
MSIGWLVVALCIVLTLLLRARSAALAIVVHAARRGASRLAVTSLVVLAVGVQAHRDAALDRWPATKQDASSTTITPTEATRRSSFTWSSKLHVRRDVLRAPPPSADARARSHEVQATERYGAALLSSLGRPPQVTHGRRPVGVDVDARRPGSHLTAELPAAVGRVQLPQWSALISAPGPGGATSPRRWHRQRPGGGAPFRNRL